MNTPSTGYYTLVAQYSGDIGFAPSSDSVTFVVRGLDNPIVVPSSLLTLASLALMIGGLCAGIFLFIRFQRTANEITGSLIGRGGTNAQRAADSFQQGSDLVDIVSSRSESPSDRETSSTSSSSEPDEPGER